MKVFLTIAFLFTITFCLAQQKAEIFEPNTISNGGVFGLGISPDSQIALWVDSKGKRDTLIIMESRKIDGVWSTPVVASFSSPNGEWKDIDPVFSPDGKKVLFQSNRPHQRDPQRTDFDIWAVDLINDTWSAPYHLGYEINTESSESYASISQKGNIYFMKENEDGKGKSDIYVSEYYKGKYQKPVNLGSPINTTERESNSFISPKEDYIIYFSTDSTGLGETDLYISFKEKGKWTSPINLGTPINSELAEFCPFYHENEKRLYFSRQEKLNGRLHENVYYYPFAPEEYR